MSAQSNYTTWDGGRDISTIDRSDCIFKAQRTADVVLEVPPYLAWPFSDPTLSRLGVESPLGTAAQRSSHTRLHSWP